MAIFFQKNRLCVGFLKYVPSLALLREWVNEYLFGLWGSKNKMFTNRKKSYYFRKKIIHSNKRLQVTQIVSQF